jgi:hypothetical protein
VLQLVDRGDNIDEPCCHQNTPVRKTDGSRMSMAYNANFRQAEEET